MKKLILIILVFFMIACKSNHKDEHNHSEHNHEEGNHEGHDHGNEENHEEGNHEGHDHGNEDSHKEEHNEGEHSEHTKNEIHLTPEQFKSAKIKIGSIEKRSVRERIEVTGTIQAPPKNKATVYTPLEAFVYQADLLLGDEVKKGQTIAVLQHPNFTKLQYNFLEAKNKLELAKQEFKRKEMLLEKEIASKKSYQLAKSNYQSAKNLMKNYSSQLKMAGLSPRKIANDGIQQYVYVKSPISGYIVKNDLNKGKFLNANSEMMEIIDNDHMHAELNVFNTDIDRLKKNDKFIFKTNGTDKEFKGYIKLISQGLNNKTKTINVHGHYEDQEHLIKVGTFINAQILLGGKLSHSVPEQAIIDFEGKKIIFKAESEGEFIPLEVTLGNSDKGFVELKTIHDDNFKVNVVTNGAHFLKGELLKNSGEMDGHGHAH